MTWQAGPAPQPTPDLVTPVTEPEWWEVLDSVGSFLAALAAMVTIIITLRQLRRTAREASADERRRHELGLLREMLDSIPSQEDYMQTMRFGLPNAVTHEQYRLLALMPPDMMPRFRQLVIALWQGGDQMQINDLLNTFGMAMPPQYDLTRRIRRVQVRECLEAIQERTGGNPEHVAMWMASVDGIPYPPPAGYLPAQPAAAGNPD